MTSFPFHQTSAFRVCLLAEGSRTLLTSGNSDGAQCGAIATCGRLTPSRLGLWGFPASGNFSTHPHKVSAA